LEGNIKQLEYHDCNLSECNCRDAYSRLFLCVFASRP